MQEVKLFEAVALSLNLNPNALEWDRFENKFEAGEDFDRRLRISESHAASGGLRLLSHCGTTHNSPVNLRAFAIWATGVWQDLPEQLHVNQVAAATVAQVPAIQAAVCTPDAASTRSVKPTKRDLLTPTIEAAQRSVTAPFDAAAVWMVLTNKAEKSVRPFIGLSEDGLKWLDQNDKAQFLSFKNLRDRISRQQKKLR
ncbi:hypothetical protein AEP_00807 [Curvibacter sp. AEP1-3]|nr:hypothetical protein AEP_00807 [Curvibacter sp. AEP1-3]